MDVSDIPVLSLPGATHTVRNELIPPESLRAIATIGDSLSFGYIVALEAAGGWLVVADRSYDQHITVIELPSGKVAARLGRHGEGPGEFVSPYWITSTNSGSAQFWIFDPRTRRLSRLDLRGGTATIDTTLSLTAPFAIYEPLWHNSGLVATGMFPDYTLIELDSTGRATRWLDGAQPYSEEEVLHRSGRARLNRGRLAAHPAGDRLAVAYQLTNRIDVVSGDMEAVATWYGPIPVEAKYRVWQDDQRGLLFAWEDDNPYGYVSLDADSTFVYGLFCGDCIARNGLPKDLHVFSWNGRLVQRLVLDREIRSIAVSSDGQFLFGAVENPYPAVAVWRLPFPHIQEDAP